MDISIINAFINRYFLNDRPSWFVIKRTFSYYIMASGGNV